MLGEMDVSMHFSLIQASTVVPGAYLSTSLLGTSLAEHLV